MNITIISTGYADLVPGAYRSPNWTALKAKMKAPVIFDGRNLYEPHDMSSCGIEYMFIRR